VLLKITVEQNGVILGQSIVEIDDDESLSVAIKSAVDTVRAQDRSKPLWGLGIKVDKLTYGEPVQEGFGRKPAGPRKRHQVTKALIHRRTRSSTEGPHAQVRTD
jgi:hypothetical protein